MLKTRTMPVGIDLGTAVIKMVQMRRTNGNLELLAAAQTDVPDDCRRDAGKRRDFLAGRLRNPLKTHGFKGRKCVLSLPAADTFIRHIKTAKMPPEELDKTLRWELAGKLPFDHTDAIIRHLTVTQISNDREAKQEVIVVAVSRQVAESYLNIARNNKMEVIALNVEPCAILECFARLLQRIDDNHGATLFLDLGQTHTQVVISHGAKLVFARNLTFCADQIEKTVGTTLEVPVEEIGSLRRKMLNSTTEPGTDADILYSAMNESLESVAGEITKCLRYYESLFPSRPVERAIFLGGQARDRRLCQGIAKQLNLSSQIGDPLAQIRRPDRKTTDTGPDFHQSQPAWAVAVGLSLGAGRSQIA